MPIRVFKHVGCVYIQLVLSNSVGFGGSGKEVQRDHGICLDVGVESKVEIGMLRRCSMMRWSWR
jgi:hypothetical protein